MLGALHRCGPLYSPGGRFLALQAISSVMVVPAWRLLSPLPKTGLEEPMQQLGDCRCRQTIDQVRGESVDMLIDRIGGRSL